MPPTPDGPTTHHALSVESDNLGGEKVHDLVDGERGHVTAR